jgi:NitT/TauT family transport system substrate-binding protein
MRWWMILSALLGLVLLLNGCSKSENDSADGAPAALGELRLGYFANVTHAQAVLGVSSGEFQAALGPTKLKTKVFNAGPELIEAINAGEVDIGYVGPGPALSADVNSRGQAIRVISGSAANGVVIVASKDSQIHSMSDLKGKRIATPQLGNTQDVSARHYVTAVLGEPDASNVKEVRNSQQSGMMARGLIDAAWVPEPWGARLISETGAVLVGQEKDVWPNHLFSLTVIVTTPRFLAAHPDVVKEILSVHHGWTRRLSVDSGQYADQLNDALAGLGGKRLPGDVLRTALSRTVFTDDPLPETFKTVEQWSYDLKFINSAPDLTGLFETGIIQAIVGPEPTTRP